MSALPPVATSASTILRSIEKFEASMAELYTSLSDRFDDDDEASRLFARLAFEEKSHRSQVEYLGRLLRKSDLTTAPVAIDPEAIEAEVRVITRMREMVGQVTLKAALLQVAQIENGAAEEQWHAALAAAHPEIAQVIRGLVAGSGRHRQSIEELARARGFVSGPPAAR